LRTLLREVRRDLVQFRLDRKVGSLADGSKIKQKRKEVTQVLTVLGEKAILEEAASSKALVEESGGKKSAREMKSVPSGEPEDKKNGKKTS